MLDATKGPTDIFVRVNQPIVQSLFLDRPDESFDPSIEVRGAGGLEPSVEFMAYPVGDKAVSQGRTVPESPTDCARPSFGTIREHG